MIQHYSELFAGYNSLAISNGSLTLHIMKDGGPRIIGLQVNGGSNLMAEVPLEGETPDQFIPRGGHRLWHGPEDPVRSYLPDNEPVSIEIMSNNNVIVTQKTEQLSGIQKSIEIEMSDSGNEVILNHSLKNHNLWPVSLAIWPITQMRVGGFALLPQSTRNTGLLPNRRVVFWPYTDVRSENIVIGNRYILLHARYQGKEKAKIGWLNEHGWMGYYLDRTLFIKTVQPVLNGEYIDLGSSMESYSDARFLEMETLSPVTTIAPQEKCEFQEKWFVFPNINLLEDEEVIEEVIRDLKFDSFIY